MEILDKVNGFLWGCPVLLLILLVGLVLSVKTNFSQIRFLPAAVSVFLNNIKKRHNTDDNMSGYRALCTALAATVGTGNIAGVAGAIALGGPGVVFWMWVSGILGMVIKFAEVSLALCYRVKNENGYYKGGPMYMIANAFDGKGKILSFFYCLLGLFATFGVGNGTQINAVVEGIGNIVSFSGYKLELSHLLIIGAGLSIVVTLVFRNGTNGIGCWAERLVPAASVMYILLACTVLVIRIEFVPAAIREIFQCAMNPKAVTGGVIGSAFLTLRVGISRGIFTNEAGMGTASIAHASADVDNPVTQGFMGLIEVFLDTIVLCSLTALVILCSDVPIVYGTDPGILLTMDAFAFVLGDWSRIAITAMVCIFAFATILGWGFYGLRFSEYLFGTKSWRIFVAGEAIVCFCAVLSNTTIIWTISEIFNGLMAIPNLMAICCLMPVFISCIRKYKKAYR